MPDMLYLGPTTVGGASSRPQVLKAAGEFVDVQKERNDELIAAGQGICQYLGKQPTSRVAQAVAAKSRT